VIPASATSAAGLAVMQILASTIFGLSFFKYGAALMPFLLVLFLLGSRWEWWAAQSCCASGRRRSG